MNDEWQRPPEQITSIEVVAVTKVGEDPKHADFWSVTQPKFEAIQAPVELQEHSQPSINAAQVMRGSDQGPGPQFLPIDQIGITVPEAASAWDHEIRIGNRDEVLISTAPFGAQRLRAALTTAALLVALGLGWIGGSNSYRFLGPNPASTPVKPKLTSSAGILRSDNETICSTPDTARQAAPGAPNTRKVATPTATRLGRHSRIPHHRDPPQWSSSTGPRSCPDLYRRRRRGRLLLRAGRSVRLLVAWSSWKGPTALGRQRAETRCRAWGGSTQSCVGVAVG